MTVIKRDQVEAPKLRSEAVTVEALGGDVIVRELKLSERLVLQESKRAAPAEGQAPGEGNADSMLALLSLAVVDADDQPVFTPAQWDAFGGQHGQVVQELFGKALNLSGYDGEANRKN